MNLDSCKTHDSFLWMHNESDDEPAKIKNNYANQGGKDHVGLQEMLVNVTKIIKTKETHHSM